MVFNGSGTLTERYLTNPNALSQYYGQVSAGSATAWFLTDNLGSIRQVISATGTSLDAITYDPYGNILSQTNSVNAPSVGFAGGTVDSLTGNVQFDARPYGPMIGRFLTTDPLEFAAGDTDLYRYVGNEPTDLVDPTGEKFCWKCAWSGGGAGAATGAVGGAVVGTVVFPVLGTGGGALLFGGVGFVDGFVYGGWFTDDPVQAAKGGAVIGAIPPALCILGKGGLVLLGRLAPLTPAAWVAAQRAKGLTDSEIKEIATALWNQSVNDPAKKQFWDQVFRELEGWW